MWWCLPPWHQLYHHHIQALCHADVFNAIMDCRFNGSCYSEIYEWKHMGHTQTPFRQIVGIWHGCTCRKSRWNDCNCAMYGLAWLMIFLPNLYSFIYLLLTSVMLLTIPGNNRWIGASMNISNDPSVFHDCWIGHFMSSYMHCVFSLVVSYMVSLIALFSPMEHRYALHCPLDQLPILTSISANCTPLNNHWNDDQCWTRQCSFTDQFVGGSMLEICVVGYPCSSSQYVDALGWSYVSQPEQLLHWRSGCPFWQCITLAL